MLSKMPLGPDDPDVLENMFQTVLAAQKARQKFIEMEERADQEILSTLSWVETS